MSEVRVEGYHRGGGIVFGSGGLLAAGYVLFLDLGGSSTHNVITRGLTNIFFFFFIQV